MSCKDWNNLTLVLLSVSLLSDLFSGALKRFVTKNHSVDDWECSKSNGFNLNWLQKGKTLQQLYDYVLN